jgi:aminopeptidase N
MSTYLLAFAVSEFRSITESKPTEFSVYSSQSALNSMRFALGVGDEALSALEEYVGHSYTLGKMDFIAIDDFLMGAMVRWKIFIVHFPIFINFSSGKLGSGIV